MKIEREGWVIINDNDSILERSFRSSRKDAINTVIVGSGFEWKHWYKKGMRCVKATKTICTHIKP